MKTSMFKRVLAFALCVWMICIIGMTAFAANGQPYEEVKSITISPSSVAMLYGGTAKVTATVYPSGANPKVNWTSSNPNLVAVDSQGNLTAAKDTAETPSGKKTVTITAISDENSKVYATCTVTVDNTTEQKTEDTLKKVLDIVKDLVSKIDVNKIVELVKSIDLTQIKDLFSKIVEIVKQLIGSAGKTTSAA